MYLKDKCYIYEFHHQYMTSYISNESGHRIPAALLTMVTNKKMNKEKDEFKNQN